MKVYVKMGVGCVSPYQVKPSSQWSWLHIYIYIYYVNFFSYFSLIL